MEWPVGKTLRSMDTGMSNRTWPGSLQLCQSIGILNERNFMIADMLPFGSDRRTDFFVLLLQLSRSKPF